MVVFDVSDHFPIANGFDRTQLSSREHEVFRVHVDYEHHGRFGGQNMSSQFGIGRDFGDHNAYLAYKRQIRM